MQLQRNMVVPSGQWYPSLKHYIQHIVTACSSNHGHLSSKCYILMFKLSSIDHSILVRWWTCASSFCRINSQIENYFDFRFDTNGSKRATLTWTWTWVWTWKCDIIVSVSRILARLTSDSRASVVSVYVHGVRKLSYNSILFDGIYSRDGTSQGILSHRLDEVGQHYGDNDTFRARWFI